MSIEYDEKLLLMLEHNKNDVFVVSEELIDDLLKSGGRGFPRDLTAYSLAVGLRQISRTHRNAVRKRIKAEDLAPIERMNLERPAARYQKASKAIQKRTLGLLTSWMVGDMYLGDMDKAGLLKAVQAETVSSNGHRVNAEFYEKLAEPLKEGQLVKDYWKDRGAQILHDDILNKLMAEAGRPQQPPSRPEDRPTA